MTARAVAAATRPATSLNLLRDAAEGLGELVWAGLNPAPETPLNVTIGPHRRFAVARQQLADYKLIKDALGGTVNDVVLTVVAGRAGGLAALPRRPHPGAGDAGAGAGLGPADAISAARSATS